MNIKAYFCRLGLALTSALVLGACGQSGSAAALDVAVQGEALKFAPAALTLKSGNEVTITLQNNSSQHHNWVLLAGDSVSEQITDRDDLEAGQEGVIAVINSVGSHSTGSATFTAPAPGTYTYVCTLAAHYVAGMKGTLTVE